MSGPHVPNAPQLTHPAIPGLRIVGGGADVSAVRFELAAAVAGLAGAAGVAGVPGVTGGAAAAGDALVMIGPDPAAAAEAVSAGAAVLCLPGPDPGATPDPALLVEASPDSAGPGFVVCSSRLRHTDAGQQLAAAGSGRLGTLISAYVAVRAPRLRSPSAAVLLWEAMDLVAGLTDAPLARVHAVSGDGLITAICRFADEMVMTVDVAAVTGVTSDSAAGGLGVGFEAEAELVGSDGILRVEPGRASVRVTGADGAEDLPFGTSPVRGMLAEFLAAVTDPGQRGALLARQRRTLSLVTAVGAADPARMGRERDRCGGA